MDKSKRPFRKFKSTRSFRRKFKSTRSFRRKFKSTRSFRRPLSRIQGGDQIDYKNISLIRQFISEQGRILSRRVTKLTLKQQRLISIAIKQARILSLLSFCANEKHKKDKLVSKGTGLRTRKKATDFRTGKKDPGPRTRKK